MLFTPVLTHCRRKLLISSQSLALYLFAIRERAVIILYVKYLI